MYTVIGICAVNSKTALSLDNSTTHDFKLDQDCYTIAVADCSPSARFIVGIKMDTINATLVSLNKICSKKCFYVKSKMTNKTVT